MSRKVDHSFVCTIGSKGAAEGQLKHPRGVAVDMNFVYVGDGGNARVNVYRKLDYSFVRAIGLKGAGRRWFKRPFGIATDGGLLYVVQGELKRVSMFR